MTEAAVLVKVGDVWLRPDAIDAITPHIIAGDSRVSLRGGETVIVRDMAPGDVVNRLAEAVAESGDIP